MCEGQEVNNKISESLKDVPVIMRMIKREITQKKVMKIIPISSNIHQ